MKPVIKLEGWNGQLEVQVPLTVKKFRKVGVEDVLTVGRVIIFEVGTEVKVGIVVGVGTEGTVSIKEQIMREPNGIQREEMEVIYEIEENYPSNFQGTFKKEMQEYVHYVINGVNPQVRIGGLMKVEKGTDEAKAGMKMLEEYFAAKGMKVKFVWSEGCGMLLKRKGEAGYNISLVNEKVKEWSRLFLDKVYYHNHYSMGVFEIVEGKLVEVDKYDEEYETMICEYVGEPEKKEVEGKVESGKVVADVETAKKVKKVVKTKTVKK